MIEWIELWQRNCRASFNQGFTGSFFSARLMWLQIEDRVQLLFWPHSLGEVHSWTKQINITNYYKSYCRNCWCCLCCHLSCNYNCRKPDGTCWMNEEVIIIRVFLCFFLISLAVIHPSFPPFGIFGGQNLGSLSRQVIGLSHWLSCCFYSWTYFFPHGLNPIALHTVKCTVAYFDYCVTSLLGVVYCLQSHCL